MRIFRQVVESNGFTAASLVLDLSVAMVSKHVRHLEDQLGTRLLNRTSRRISLTPAGELYITRCCEILNGIEEAENVVRCVQQQPRGTLKISAPTWFANRFFARLLHSYRLKYPEVGLEVSLADAFVDLVEEGLDVALRVSNKPESRLPVRSLGTMEFVFVASRSYLERHGRPTSTGELSQHRVLLYTHAGESFASLGLTNSGWKLDNTSLIGQLAAEGAGVALLPRILVEQESYGQELELLLPAVEIERPNFYAVTHERRQLSARVTTFLDFLSDHFQHRACGGATNLA